MFVLENIKYLFSHPIELFKMIVNPAMQLRFGKSTLDRLFREAKSKRNYTSYLRTYLQVPIAQSIKEEQGDQHDTSQRPG